MKARRKTVRYTAITTATVAIILSTGFFGWILFSSPFGTISDMEGQRFDVVGSPLPPWLPADARDLVIHGTKLFWRIRFRPTNEAAAQTFVTGMGANLPQTTSNGAVVEQPSINATAVAPESLAPGSSNDATSMFIEERDRPWAVSVTAGFVVSGGFGPGVQTWTFDRTSGLLYGEIASW